MPRVILRTVEPAKELACQSVEKRCTRMKASRATSDIVLQRERHDRLQADEPQNHRDKSERHDAAERDQRRARAAGSAAPDVSASTRWPETPA